ncbi:putative translocation protein in type III secretion [Vibrio parahaemolyticus AQ3810]|nr:putative translocation protein in type III secretion [Vibrio parahaemolyticus AQ3810]
MKTPIPNDEHPKASQAERTLLNKAYKTKTELSVLGFFVGIENRISR